jgi:ribulose-5-phosphate 4-epimerase/fuculose-1-phosphate aldolase
VLRKTLRQFMNRHNAAPKVILMLNHGPVILGQSDRDVFNTMLMLDKWAKVLIGNYTIDSPRFFDDKISDRIEDRPDEHYRRRVIGKLESTNY